MPIDLPIAWVVALNLAGWPVIQLGLAWAFTRMPVAWFSPRGGLRERDQQFYERALRITPARRALNDFDHKHPQVLAELTKKAGP